MYYTYKMNAWVCRGLFYVAFWGGMLGFRLVGATPMLAHASGLRAVFLLSLETCRFCRSKAAENPRGKAGPYSLGPCQHLARVLRAGAHSCARCCHSWRHPRRLGRSLRLRAGRGFTPARPCIRATQTPRRTCLHPPARCEAMCGRASRDAFAPLPSAVPQTPGPPRKRGGRRMKKTAEIGRNSPFLPYSPSLWGFRGFMQAPKSKAKCREATGLCDEGVSRPRSCPVVGILPPR